MGGTQEHNTEDRLLVKRVLDGDTAAFRTIIKNTEGLVAQIIFKMVSIPEERKDLAQDVYLKAFQHLKNFKFQSKLSTWIGQITYHRCINYLEKKKLVLIGWENENDEAIQTQKVDTEIENKMFQKEISKILKSEIEKLPPLYSTLISLFHQEGFSYLEISEITDMPEGTVKNYLFRARKKLKENILRHYNKEAL